MPENFDRADCTFINDIPSSMANTEAAVALSTLCFPGKFNEKLEVTPSSFVKVNSELKDEVL